MTIIEFMPLDLFSEMTEQAGADIPQANAVTEKPKPKTRIIMTTEINPSEIRPVHITQAAHTVSPSATLTKLNDRPIVADPTEEGYEKAYFTDEEAEEIAVENEKLVYYVANRFRSTGISIDELSSVGFLGYAKAIKTFDKNRNVKFSTYAINVIKNEICYFLRKENKHRSKNVSLNTILSTDQNGNPFELTDIIDGEEMPPVDEQLMTDDRHSMLMEIIDRLPEKEQYIIRNRYELTGGVKKTQKQISEEIDMSQANVSKLQKNAIRKLKLYLSLKMEDKELTFNKAMEL